MTAQVRLTSSLELSLLPNMYNFINTTKLPLSTAPYFIAQSTTANGLWSSIRSSFLLFIIIIFLFIQKRKGIYEWFLEQLLLNAWTRGSSRLAPFLDEGVTSSSMHFSPYIYPTSFLIFSDFIIVDLHIESSSFWELCSHHLAKVVAFIVVLLLRSSPLKELST